MRLPRRTPWANLNELDQVCGWIYSDAADIKSRQAALNRLCAWKANTAIPHALDITISLISVILDDARIESQSTASSSNLFSLRQAYALAIVRLVNNLVDPLQQGAFARSITAIASQIGLPAWFVELRHQATHEDLPSLAVLREAAKEALAWLLRHYFIPTIHPMQPANIEPSISLPPFGPLIQEYKALMKLQIGDSSLISRQQDDLNRILRNVERWISEVNLAFGRSPSLDIQGIGGEDADDWDETLALDYLCEKLVVKGVLLRVPKKHDVLLELHLPSNRAIWSPLLAYIYANHEGLPSRLVNRLISVLTDPAFDESHAVLAAGWILWISQAWAELPGCTAEDIVQALLGAMGKLESPKSDDSAIAILLVKAVASNNPILAAKADTLLDTMFNAITPITPEVDAPDLTVKEMARRLDLLSAKSAPRITAEVDAMDVVARTQPQCGSDVLDVIAPGWTLMNPQTWEPCAMGVYYHGSAA
ncbi:rRNA-processing protein las1 [Tulasnella sp. JGI-2019a]|nr:rRNA-processing protein las1 [Tulasnella sp. JGI-2019a]